MLKIFKFYAPVLTIRFDWGLTLLGRVLIRIGGGVKENRIGENKTKSVV